MDRAVAHQQHVDAWVARVAAGAPAHRLAQLLEEATAALWSRAVRTLGDVTLAAIADRVLHQAKRRFPVLGPIVVSVDGISCDPLRRDLRDGCEDELRGALRFVLVELLTVLGSLTGEVLTAPLHDELDRVATNGHGAALRTTSDPPRPLPAREESSS